MWRRVAHTQRVELDSTKSAWLVGDLGINYTSRYQVERLEGQDSDDTNQIRCVGLSCSEIFRIPERTEGFSPFDSLVLS